MPESFEELTYNETQLSDLLPDFYYCRIFEKLNISQRHETSDKKVEYTGFTVQEIMHKLTK